MNTPSGHFIHLTTHAFSMAYFYLFCLLLSRPLLFLMKNRFDTLHTPSISILNWPSMELIYCVRPIGFRNFVFNSIFDSTGIILVWHHDWKRNNLETNNSKHMKKTVSVELASLLIGFYLSPYLTYERSSWYHQPNRLLGKLAYNWLSSPHTRPPCT